MAGRDTLDRFYSIRLGVSVADLKPGQVAVASCDRRTYVERGHAHICLLWVIGFGDRAAVSVHPAALAEAGRLAWGLRPDEVLEDDFSEGVRRELGSRLGEAGLQLSGDSVIFWHPGSAQKVASEGAIRAVAPGEPDAWVGERYFRRVAEHPSAGRGEAFGLWVGEALVAEVVSHEPPVTEMAGLVAEDGIQVSQRHRGRGYGKALLAHWTREMQARGRVCVHSTSLENAASIALARSVGYIEYGRTRQVRYASAAGM